MTAWTSQAAFAVKTPEGKCAKARDYGSAIANDVARTAVVPPHREGGQAQFIRRPVPDSPSSSANPTRAWAMDNLDQPLTLHALAAHSNQSVRTFTRRFRDEVRRNTQAVSQFTSAQAGF